MGRKCLHTLRTAAPIPPPRTRGGGIQSLFFFFFQKMLNHHLKGQRGEQNDTVLVHGSTIRATLTCKVFLYCALTHEWPNAPSRRRIHRGNAGLQSSISSICLRLSYTQPSLPPSLPSLPSPFHFSIPHLVCPSPSSIPVSIILSSFLSIRSFIHIFVPFIRPSRLPVRFVPHMLLILACLWWMDTRRSG